MSSFFCSELARASNEQLFGTAKQVGAFIVLEYASAWKRKAIDSDLLPEQVRSFVGAVRAQVPEIRFLLARQPASKQRRPSCFVALPRETDPVVYQFELDDYRDLGGVDAAAVLSGATGIARRAQPMFMICAHAQHDKCCARHGTAAIEAVRAGLAGGIWESSHLGGCRFAANLLCLPHGLLYGFLSPADALRAIHEYSAGRILLPHLRGRACYSKPVQTAEYFLRSETGMDGIDQLRLVESIQTAPANWTTTFEVRDSGERYSVDHAATRAEEPRLLSCSDVEPEFVWISRLTALRRQANP